MDEGVRSYIDAIPPANRPLFDRLDRIIREEAPNATVTLSYAMPTYTLDRRRIHVGAWKHGISLYGWNKADDGGFVQRHPELQTSTGTIRLRPVDADGIDDDELRALIAPALRPT
jgi:uncharacterized protein YdhG (YjbR/CyaY superfamily)